MISEAKLMPNPDSVLCREPIFIIGITQRCGTNFLYDLLNLHPDCSAPPLIWEDYLISTSGLLDSYVNSVSRIWARSQGDGLKDELYRHLGDGLISFLNEQVDTKRVITKTPSIHSLENFFKLFPRLRLLILVRDGRAVVESSVKSFGKSYEASIHKWATAADTILRFEQANRNTDFKYLIVRYEDIYSNPEQELGRIFAFLDLNAEVYDFGAAKNLPIRGSSNFHGKEKKSVHWEPVEKSSDFKPLQRWSHWGQALHKRFNWVAGQYLVQFGYEQKQYTTNWFFWKMRNQAMDKWWQVKELSRFARQIQKRIFKKLSNVVH